MENHKDDKYYIEKMKVHFERILDTIANVSYDNYLNDLDSIINGIPNEALIHAV